MRRIAAIIIHCTATQPSANIESIQKYWRSIGWDKDGYHYIIDQEGVFTQLEAEEDISYGIGNGNGILTNANVINVAYIGGVDENGKPMDTRTPAQQKTMYQLIKALLKDYPRAKVLGHRDLSPDLNNDGIIEKSEWIKACPSFDVKTWLASYNLGSKFGKKFLKK